MRTYTDGEIIVAREQQYRVKVIKSGSAIEIAIYPIWRSRPEIAKVGTRNTAKERPATL